jgi:FAD/FMN-containing dehydrogenase
MVEAARQGFEARLRAAGNGDVLFDAFSRGRYATDASHYQMTPIGVVVPKTVEAALRAIAIAREEGVPVKDGSARAAVHVARVMADSLRAAQAITEDHREAAQ